MSGVEAEITDVAVELVDNPEGIVALKSDWDRLIDASAYATIFQTFEWHQAWWSAFGDSLRLHILVIKIGKTVAGLCPLMSRGPHESPHKRVLEFMGTPNADYCDIIGPDKRLLWGAVLKYLGEHVDQWGTVILDQISERSPSATILEEALKNSGVIHRKTMSDLCVAYEYDGPANEREHFELYRAKNVKKAVRLLENMGKLKYERYDGEEVEHHLNALMHLHITRWSQTSTPSKFLQEKNRQFYHELATQLSPKDEIHLTALYAGTIPVAYCLKFDFRGTVNHYTLAFNPYLTKFSPGVVFVTYQTEQLVRRGLYLDFSRGAQDYKSVLTNRAFTNYRFQLFNSAGNAILYELRVRFRSIGLVQWVVKNRKFASLRAKVSTLADSGSILALIRRLFERAWRRVYEQHEILIFAHEGEHEAFPLPFGNVLVRELSDADLPQIATFYGAPMNGPKFNTLKSRFEKGADCFAVFVEDNLVSVSWGLFTPDVDPFYRFTLSPNSDEVVLSDYSTSIPYRGRSLVKVMLDYQLRKYHSQGKRCIMATMHDNVSMQGAIKPFNFSLIRSEKVQKVFGRPL